MARAVLTGPLGPVTLTEVGGVIVSLSWRAEPGESSDLLREATAQLAAYFHGRLTVFDLPLDWGAGLQGQVRRAMAAIRLGKPGLMAIWRATLGPRRRRSGRLAGPIRSRS